MKLPHEKLGLSELAYILAFSQGSREAYDKVTCSYKKGTALRRAYDKGRREARRIY